MGKYTKTRRLYLRNFRKTAEGKARRELEKDDYYSKGAPPTNRKRKWEQNEILLLWDKSVSDLEISLTTGRSLMAIQVKRAKSIPPKEWEGKADRLKP